MRKLKLGLGSPGEIRQDPPCEDLAETLASRGCFAFSFLFPCVSSLTRHLHLFGGLLLGPLPLQAPNPSLCREPPLSPSPWREPEEAHSYLAG